jgi:tetratricopeptide (TPR) repeat protein
MTLFFPGGFSRPKLLAGLAAAAALLIGLAALMEARASGELGEARALAKAGDFAGADRHYFQALNWYAPWGSSQRAADELMALAVAHLEAGRRPEALQSLLRLRSALIAARSFYQPREDLLAEATPLIALSLARLKLGDAAGREELLAQAAIYQQRYSEDPVRAGIWPLLAVCGFLLWAGAAFRLVFAYFQAPGPHLPLAPRERRALLIISAVFALGYLTWLFSMSQA